MTKKQKEAEERFLVNFNYYSSLLLDKAYKCKRDLRFTCFALVEEDNGKITVRYNPKLMCGLSEALIVCLCLHEIAHILQDLPYDTPEEQVMSERKAEQQALRWLWKYNRKYYYETVRFMREELKHESYKHRAAIHYEAFKGIKAYQER